MGDLDLLVLGELNIDLVVDCADQLPRFGQAEVLVPGLETVLGSSGAITACGAARLGLGVGMASSVGDDPQGAFALACLNEREVDTTYCLVREGGRTGVTVVLARADGDRAMLTFAGEIGRLRVEDLPSEAFDAPRHVHISSYFLQRALWPDLPLLLRALRQRGVTVSIDPNWDPSGGWDHGLAALLGDADLLFPNEAEACHLTGIEDPSAAAARLASQGPTVVLKRGRAGALLVRPDGSWSSVDSPEIEAVDTTGAGDSFDAGFLAARLRGVDDEQALRLASVCGALSTRALGGTAAQPTAAEAEPFIAGLTVATDKGTHA